MQRQQQRQNAIQCNETKRRTKRRSYSFCFFFFIQLKCIAIIPRKLLQVTSATAIFFSTDFNFELLITTTSIHAICTISTYSFTLCLFRILKDKKKIYYNFWLLLFFCFTSDQNKFTRARNLSPKKIPLH